MKTIEEVAFSKYLSDQKLPKHKRMAPENYIDWANFGAIEAQRWIPVEEELPPLHEFVLVKSGKSDTVCIGHLRADGVWHSGWSIIEYPRCWRPIERI